MTDHEHDVKKLISFELCHATVLLMAAVAAPAGAPPRTEPLLAQGAEPDAVDALMALAELARTVS